jgi:sterol desaturase/sphingolipid hydroxylase (fatty acid hydroxylase superfamily)
VKNKGKWYDILDYLVGGTIGLIIASFFTSNHYVAAVWFIISGIILDTIMTNIKKSQH